MAEGQLNALLNKFETGPRYQFKVYYDEVDVHQLKNKNNRLRGEKRALEESLVQEEAKRLRVDEKARQGFETAEKKGAFYKKKFVQLAKKLIKNGKKSIGPAKKKFNDYSKHHQKRIKNQHVVKRAMADFPKDSSLGVRMDILKTNTLKHIQTHTPFAVDQQ